ncbi:DUF4861 family protein [Sediminibacterium ginsengisoli]|uniref:DUF4861 domain-containing protein n=1 Tax=Sediminibacterium ginsengisoli TaxID=413434 RepID=A0A1T4P7S6_9BACT|nr:DUF4861 family protein [Sediminibacterium ginsengisoli]SJZ86948.1 protein of unknown function [Sediminibacterium ginsengisoli]
MKRTKNCRLAFLFLLLPSLMVSAQTSIRITNSTADKRLEELAELPYSTFIAAYPAIAKQSFRLVTESGKEIPYQLEYNGQTEPRSILIPVTLAANASLRIYVKAGKPAPVKPRSFARYVPERYDDFAWENDKVAFRVYGKALEGRKDNAYGMDVWSKRTSELIIDKWYKSGDYHKDHGEGMDYYSVGFTLGAGDIAPYVNDSIYFTHNYSNWELLDNGPLRSSFRLTYPARNVAGTMVTVTKIIRIDAGSQLSRVEAFFRFEGKDSLPLAVGIVKRGPGGASLLQEDKGIMGYWEPESPLNGVTGIGTIFTSQVKSMNLLKPHLLTLTAKQASGEPFIYYTGAAWNRAGLIRSDNDWFAYLRQYAGQLKQPLRVEIR